MRNLTAIFFCFQSQVKAWSRKSNVTYIATPAQSWLDDYFDWSRDCCIYNASTNGFCSSTSGGGDTAYEDYESSYDYYAPVYLDLDDFKAASAAEDAAAAADLSTCQECDSRGK